MASPGSGTAPHMAGELFKMMAGVDLVHVPYRWSATAFTDLMGGQVHVMFGLLTSSMQYVRAGKLRALAVSSASRSDALPDIPTVGDFLPGATRRAGGPALVHPKARRPGHHYSITSSAMASSVSGTVRHIAFAVLRLITSSCFVGACTGKSAGFSPLRMRST
jgi:Tripartite tricarboxylate transporter family receptor